MDLATSAIAPAVNATCPGCKRPISMRVWPCGDGTLEYDAELSATGLKLHMMYGCERPQ